MVIPCTPQTTPLAGFKIEGSIQEPYKHNKEYKQQCPDNHTGQSKFTKHLGKHDNLFAPLMKSCHSSQKSLKADIWKPSKSSIYTRLLLVGVSTLSW
jgi:hypothetical protein